MFLEASRNSPGCSSANSFPTSRDRAALDGRRLRVCEHVCCVLKALHKGRKSFHAPSSSHQLGGAPEAHVTHRHCLLLDFK